MHNDTHKAEQEATTIFVPEQKGNRMFQIKFPHPTDKCLRGSLPKSGPLDFATKNTFPLFFVGEEALVGVY